tara:strand:+ start:1514 stop:2458 length:945 start_codon:yes stop_codon:yes gene_type:complete
LLNLIYLNQIKNNSMKFRNIFWGIFLIFLGFLFTLDNLNVIEFSWYNLWRLWPVFLILWGISILPIKNFIKVIFVLIILLGSIGFMMNNTVRWKDSNFQFHYSIDNSDFESNDEEFTIPFEDTIEFANLDVEVVSSFVIADESYGLIDFQKSGSNVDYRYTIKQMDNSVDVNVYVEDEKALFTNPCYVEMSLNPYPVWDMNYEVGAADVKMDFTGLKIRNLYVEGGAASLKIKLGDKFDKTNVHIETGASSIFIEVPKEVGCDLSISAVLSGKSISGFEKIDHGHYRTENFSDAANKIYLDVETAVSSYSIIRY